MFHPLTADLFSAGGKKDAPISKADMDRIMCDDLPGPEVPEPLLLEQTEQTADDDQLRADRLRDGERLWLRGVTSP